MKRARPTPGMRWIDTTASRQIACISRRCALRSLEDLGFYAVDNLPLPLVPKLVELLASRPDVDRAALGLDARSGHFLDGAIDEDQIVGGASAVAELQRTGDDGNICIAGKVLPCLG